MANVIAQVGDYAAIAVGLAVVGSAVSLILRYRRALNPEKAQLAWLGLAAALLVVSLVAGFILNVAGLGESVVGQLTHVITFLSIFAIPVSIGFALLRRGLYGAAPVLGSSIVYTALTFLLASIFGVVVGLVAFLFPGEERLGGALLATAVVAIIVQPLRERIQRRVSRLFYGYRDEPYRAVVSLGQRLGDAATPESVLGEIADTIASSLRVPAVSVEMITSGGIVRVDHGEPNHDVTEIPLVSRGRTVGRMIVGTREPGRALGDADVRLLEDLAAQAAIAVEASHLALELHESRRGIVTAREDERLRIRRDLHDGLGSALTGIGLGLHAASNELTKGDPAQGILEDLIAETTSAVQEVRRIVAGLRAPLLDELGLERALRQQADRLTHRSPALEIKVDFDSANSRIPSAVEGAVFGIVSEALTNVAKHSLAKHCAVRIQVAEDVQIEVVDDGVGFSPDVRPGNGVSSMQQRAEELGGRVTITSDPRGGTRVQAQLPSVFLEAI
jgi:signal transduction histidine kinase